MHDREDALLRAEARALWQARGQPIDRDLDIWLEAEARLVPTLPLRAVEWSRFTASRTHLLTRHGLRDLCLWDVTGMPTLVARCRSGNWRDAATCGDRIVIVGVEPAHGLVVRDARDGHVVAAADIAISPGYRQDIHEVRLSDDGSRAAAATRHVWPDAYDPSWHDHMTMVDTATGRVTPCDTSGPVPGIDTIALAPDGTTVTLLGSTWARGKNGLLVLDAASGIPRWHTMLTAAVESGRRWLLVSADGGTLVVVDARQLTRWDAYTGTPRETHTLDRSLDLAALSPDGRLIAGVVGDRLWTWRVDTAAPVLCHALPARPSALAFDADDERLCIAMSAPDPTLPRVMRVAIPAS